jgi:tetratricopeptide (TPR) repeat protein
MITLSILMTKRISIPSNNIRLLLMIFITWTFACAGANHRPQSIDITPSIVEAAERDPGSEPLKITEAVENEITDSRQADYFNYMIATIENNRGNYKTAGEYLSKVLETNPESFLLNKKMAIIMRNSGNPAGAIKYARRGLEINPDDVGIQLLLAELYILVGDGESARLQYQKILDLDPENQQVRMIYAAMLIRQGSYDLAMVQLNPDLVIAYYYRGRIYLEFKKYDEAEKEYRKALEIDESMEPALFDLAGLYYIKENYNKAAEIYEKILSIYPRNRIAKERLLNIYSILGKKDNIESMIEELKNRSNPGDRSRQAVGLYYLRNGRLAESIKELDLIVSTWPGDYKSRYYLAMAYEKNGQSELALHHFRLIGEDTELYIGSQIHIAYILDELGRHDEAIETVKRAIETKRDEIDLYMILSNVYESRKEFEKAKDIIIEGLKYDANNIELLYRLGVLLDKLGDKDGSIAQMKKVLEIEPNHADSLNYIGYTYAEKGIHLDEALDMIQRALVIEPNSGYIIDSLGWVYYQQGLYDKALDSLKKAFSLISGDPTIAEHLGDVYLKKNEYGLSLEMYQKALALDHQHVDKILKKIEEIKKLME